MFLGKLYSLAAAAMLVGCQAPDFSAQDDARCRGMSAVPGTQAYIDCRLILDQRRSASQADAARNIGRAIGRGLGG